MTRRPLVVVADDAEDILELVCMRLERAGCETYAARNGEETVQLVLALNPDLVVLDITMPGPDGFEVCRAIQRSLPHPPPVIFLSARADNHHVVTGLTEGAVDYLTKPFDVSVLLARVAVALRTKRQFDELRAAV